MLRHDCPSDWNKGELLNVRNFDNGNFKVCRMTDDPDNATTAHVSFAGSSDCQEFVSWWYNRENGR